MFMLKCCNKLVRLKCKKHLLLCNTIFTIPSTSQSQSISLPSLSYLSSLSGKFTKVLNGFFTPVTRFLSLYEVWYSIPSCKFKWNFFRCCFYSGAFAAIVILLRIATNVIMITRSILVKIKMIVVQTILRSFLKLLSKS